MTRVNQPDLFHYDEQSDLFGENSPTPEYRPDPDSVRTELYKILAEERRSFHGSRRRFCFTEPSFRR